MPELRKDPIIGRWVIISTERGKRPHDFLVEPEVTKGGFCPFDPGNEHTTPPEVLAPRDGFGGVPPAYRDRIVGLSEDPRFKYVLIFKNQGRAAGASLEHSHSQLIGLPIVPELVMEELTGSKFYYGWKGRCGFCDQ